jgi:hypothetical protein
MLRAVFLLATCAIPATAQVSSRPAAYASLQFSHLRMRSDNGTVQGASGSGLALRLGMRPLSPGSRLLTEGAITYIPGSDSPFNLRPPVWGANLGALFSLAPLGAKKATFNPFAALAVGFITYDGPADDPSQCRFEEGCMDESPDLHGTKPSFTVGGGSWIALYAGLALRLDVRWHHRFGVDGGDSEDAWSPELSAGAAYHF